MRWCWSVLLAVVLALSAAPLPGAATATARTAQPAVGGIVRVVPAAPVVGQPFTVRGRAPSPGLRRLRLEAWRLDRWQPVGWTTSAASGRYAFPRTAREPSRFRVVAPRTAGRPTWRSAAVRVLPVAQSAALAVPAAAVVGETVRFEAAFTPPRAGRGVLLQRRGPDGWTPVDAAAQDPAGRVGFDVDVIAAGRHAYRVEAPAAGGAPSVRSAAATLVSTAPRLEPVPRLDIVTDDGAEVTSKTDYSHATMSLVPRGSGLEPFTAGTRLRVRGNTTSWATIKLPYKVKLDASTALAGMPTSKDWVLLSNFYDRTLLRNGIAFEIGRRLGMPWTPRMVDVEVWLNGTYRGVYQLGEGIEVDEDRVDIELAEDDPSNGGYLLEADKWPDDKPSLTTDRGLQVYVDQPSDVDADYVAGVRGQLQSLEDALYGPDFADPALGYRAHVDVGSFVDWYLVNETMKNLDSGFNNSVWMYRDIGGLLSMGPVWDFDLGSGNYRWWDVTEPTGWFLRRNWGAEGNSQLRGEAGHWLNRVFEDPWFVEQVEQRWSEVRADLLTLPAHVDARVDVLAGAAERNFAPPPDGAGMPIGPSILDTPEWHVFFDSWREGTDHLAGWLDTRVRWMDAELTDP